MVCYLKPFKQDNLVKRLVFVQQKLWLHLTVSLLDTAVCWKITTGQRLVFYTHVHWSCTRVDSLTMSQVHLNTFLTTLLSGDNFKPVQKRIACELCTIS